MRCRGTCHVMFHIRRPHYDHYDIRTYMVGVFELPVLLEHAYDVQIQAIGGSRIRAHRSFDALSLRSLQSPLSIPTFLGRSSQHTGPSVSALIVIPSSPRFFTSTGIDSCHSNPQMIDINSTWLFPTYLPALLSPLPSSSRPLLAFHNSEERQLASPRVIRR